MFKKVVQPLSEGMADAIGKSIKKIQYVSEAMGTRPADKADGDVKAQDISGEEEVKTDASAKKAPARKGDKAGAEPMQKVKEEAELEESSCGTKHKKEEMDPVNKVAVKKKFDDRKDKDIDNDGDVDSSDEYLHKRRKAISKALESKKPNASVDESAELEGLDENMSRVGKELEAYARKSGGIDKNDFLKAAMMMKKGQKKQLMKFVDDLDTEPREKILDLINKDTARRKEYKAAQKSMREEVELEESIENTYVRMMQKKVGEAQKALDPKSSLVKKVVAASGKGKEFKKINDALTDVYDMLGDIDMNIKEEIELDEAYKTPAEAKAYEAGKSAWRAKKKYDMNPNKKGTPEHTAWSKGHNDARAKFVKRYGSNEEKMRYESIELEENMVASLAKDFEKRLKKQGYSSRTQERERMATLAMAKKKGAKPADMKALDAAMVKIIDKLDEEVRLDEAKSDYTIYHKTFSSAVQHAVGVAKKRGFEVDEDEYDRKVAMGPRKPSKGKTNSYSISLTKGGKPVKQKLHMQVYYDEGRYELNMYIS